MLKPVHFIAQIAEKIPSSKYHDYVRDDYDRLVLVAPAATLGELRKALNAHATDRLAAEIAKDLTNLPEHELPKHLEDYL